MAETTLTPEQVAEYREAFNVFDKKSEGCISTKELGTVMRSIGQNPSDNELQEMIKQADADGSGTIQFEQFLKLMSAQKSEGESLEEIIEAFRVFDTDGDGKFSTADMTRILKNLGEPLTQEEIDEIIAQADPQKEGLIDYAAFAKLMLTS